MKLHSYKYQGAGNDFVILDNRDGRLNLTPEQVRLLCDRRFGIGSDGLMTLDDSDRYDFTMHYYNADGYEGTMCGNGGRCLVAFAAHRGIRNFEFEAVDGYHCASVVEYGEHRCTVRLKLRDLPLLEGGASPVDCQKEGVFLNTGSDHFVIFTDDVASYDVAGEGKRWRYDRRFPEGANINFVEATEYGLKVRTYERGVEAETYACGTGVTASSIASYLKGVGAYTRTSEGIHFAVQAQGGRLAVDFVPHDDGSFSDIFLTGPATFVFETDFDLSLQR